MRYKAGKERVDFRFAFHLLDSQVHRPISPSHGQPSGRGELAEFPEAWKRFLLGELLDLLVVTLVIILGNAIAVTRRSAVHRY